MTYPYEVEPQVRVKTSRGALWFAFLFFLIAGGAGYFAWQEYGQLRSAKMRLEASNSEKSKLVTESGAMSKQVEAFTAQRDALSNSDRELSEVKAQLAAAESRLHETEEQRAETESRLAEFRDVMEKFRYLIDAGTLKVDFRHGRMIVDLPASVLFDSGSAELSEDGKKAVIEVAHVLANVPQRRFVVAGHTDAVPAVKEYKSNWALSSARAVTVLEALIRAGLSPARLAAAGYAEFDPVATNGSAPGRQKNRRIEIVLEPYLSKIPGKEGGASLLPASKAPNQK
jgi:chemotaxis protein MotB